MLHDTPSNLSENWLSPDFLRAAPRAGLAIFCLPAVALTCSWLLSHGRRGAVPVAARRAIFSHVIDRQSKLPIFSNSTPGSLYYSTTGSSQQAAEQDKNERRILVHVSFVVLTFHASKLRPCRSGKAVSNYVSNYSAATYASHCGPGMVSIVAPAKHSAANDHIIAILVTCTVSALRIIIKQVGLRASHFGFDLRQ